jgi:hypothetical protein
VVHQNLENPRAHHQSPPPPQHASIRKIGPGGQDATCLGGRRPGAQESGLVPKVDTARAAPGRFCAGQIPPGSLGTNLVPRRKSGANKG